MCAVGRVDEQKSGEYKSCRPTSNVDEAAMALEQLQTQKIRQVMCVSLAFSPYNRTDARIGEYFWPYLRKVQ